MKNRKVQYRDSIHATAGSGLFGKKTLPTRVRFLWVPLFLILQPARCFVLPRSIELEICKAQLKPSKKCLFSKLDNSTQDSENALAHNEQPALESSKLLSKPAVLTNAVLQISYDGSRYTGWSAANTDTSEPGTEGSTSQLSRPSKRLRRRGVMGEPRHPKGFVRSVEGVLRDNLAKIYGNVDSKRIVVEGCSRTDRGVHAKGMIAQIYCLKKGVLENLNEDDLKIDPNAQKGIETTIPGKNKPHPRTSTDMSYFEPLPMNGNLSRLAFALNRMRPPDLQVTGIAPTPFSDQKSSVPFHSSLSAESKTYEYRISVGAFQDPTQRRLVWHVGEKLDIAKVQEGCSHLIGKHNFEAFQGAPRGPEDKKKREKQKRSERSTKCHIIKLEIHAENAPITQEMYFPGVNPAVQSYRIVVQGDRFLYKMVRFLVGALVALGLGKLELEDFDRALERGDWEIEGTEPTRRKEFECAPAHGLTLAHVDYAGLDMEWQPLRY